MIDNEAKDTLLNITFMFGRPKSEYPDKNMRTQKRAMDACYLSLYTYMLCHIVIPYMHQNTDLSLIQLIASNLYDAKPSPEAVPEYSHIDP